VSMIKANKEEPNLYEKVNWLLKGYPRGSAALRQEVKEIIEDQKSKFFDMLKNMETEVTQA
jgi:hypothetical protein